VADEVSQSAPAVSVTSDLAPSKKSKSKKKKKTPAPQQSDVDEVDLAIQEISQKYGDIVLSSSPSPSTFNSPSSTTALLSVSTKFLDADVELRKLFGKLVDTEKKNPTSLPGVSPRLLNRLKSAQPARKRTLMAPKDEWQLFLANNKRMLSMDVVGREAGTTQFKFVHSRKYQETEMKFFIICLGGDGELLMQLHQEAPLHVDSWSSVTLPC
jgi:transcription factor 25